MAERLEVVANRIAFYALHEVEGLGRVGPGPVLSVVRDTATNRIYVGFNRRVTANIATVLQNSINAQRIRIANGEVIVVHTEPAAMEGGHAEVDALNAAIHARERLLGRRLDESDLRVFELHNIWLNGRERVQMTAPRCEHCRRITRGVSVTQSVFTAEGGVMGEISVPQRGSVRPAGASSSKPVTTASGSIGFGPGGGGMRVGSAMAAGIGGLLTGAFLLAQHRIKQWFVENYLAKRWKEEERAMVLKAINLNIWRFQGLITTRLADIKQARQHGKQVVLHVAVDTEWVSTDLGPAMIKATVSRYELVFEGQTPGEWPLFQPKYRPIVHSGLGAPQIHFQRETFDFPL